MLTFHLPPVNEGKAAASIGNRTGTVQPPATSSVNYSNPAAGQSSKGKDPSARNSHLNAGLLIRGLSVLAGKGAFALQVDFHTGGASARRGWGGGPVPTPREVGSSVAKEKACSYSVDKVSHSSQRKREGSEKQLYNPRSFLCVLNVTGKVRKWTLKHFHLVLVLFFFYKQQTWSYTVVSQSVVPAGYSSKYFTDESNRFRMYLKKSQH